MKNKGILYLIAFLWLIVNLWSSLPIHSNGEWVVYAISGVFLINFFVFGIIAWYGRLYLPIPFTLLWPILIYLGWSVMPALQLASMYGRQCFLEALLKNPSLLDVVYLLLCSVIFIVFFLLSGRRIKNKGESAMP